MKLKKRIVAGVCALLVPFSLHAADEQDDHAGHDHAGEQQGKDEHAGHNHAAKVAGPNGGRVLTSVEPHAEFFVTKDRKVQITFLDHENKVVPAGEQTVRAICGERSAPTRLTFTKKDGVLTSDKPLPAGKNIPTVLQITAKSGAKPVMERFNLNLNDCPSCEHLEYACTCPH